MKIARESRMSSQPSQPLKAQVYFRKLAIAKMARILKIASQPSQPAKATIHILESDITGLSANSERFKNGKSTKSTIKSTHTYLETSLSQNGESFENSKSTKSTGKSDHTHIEK